MEQRHLTAYFDRAKSAGLPPAESDWATGASLPAGKPPTAESSLSGEEEPWPPAFSVHSKSTISMLDFLVKRPGPPRPAARPAKRLRAVLGTAAKSQRKITQFALRPARDVPAQHFRLTRYLLHRVMTFLLLRENARLAACCRFFRATFRHLWAVPDYLDAFSTDWMAPAELYYLRRKMKTVHLELLDKLLCGRVAKSFLERNSICIAAHAPAAGQRRLVREFTARPQARLNRAVNLLDRDLEALLESSRQTLYLLELRKCVYLTAKGFELLPQFRRLRTLRLASVDLPEEVFLRIVDNCRFLGELALIQCPTLTGRGLAHLLCGSTWLMQLDLSLSPGLFDGFHDFGLFARPKLLEALDLTGSGLPPDALRRVLAAAAGLKRLALADRGPAELAALARPGLLLEQRL